MTRQWIIWVSSRLPYVQAAWGGTSSLLCFPTVSSGHPASPNLASVGMNKAVWGGANQSSAFISFLYNLASNYLWSHIVYALSTCYIFHDLAKLNEFTEGPPVYSLYFPLFKTNYLALSFPPLYLYLSHALKPTSNSTSLCTIPPDDLFLFWTYWKGENTKVCLAILFSIVSALIYFPTDSV